MYVPYNERTTKFDIQQHTTTTASDATDLDHANTELDGNKLV